MLRATHVGTATLLLEVGGLRLLTDPALDPAGGAYDFGWGTGSTKTLGPALAPDALGPLDAILLTHDHHADNLDAAGRALLPTVPRVVTTVSGARRLGGNATGLAPWAATTLEARGASVRVTATPARHGPPLSRPFVGDVVGFLLEWDGQPGPVYISGDTVLFAGVREVARRARPAVAFLHVGGVRFPITGPLRYTFDATEAAEAARLLDAPLVVPVHYDGWSHFRDPRERIAPAFAAAGLADRLRWLEPGRPTDI